MFRIGEFSNIARVTTKLLRYYDRLGRLAPVRVDPATGYRYYSAEQLPRLNRILALKDMGFSLEEIGDLVEAEVPAAELRGMLAVKHSELRSQLDTDLRRLRVIESRIDSIDAADPADSAEEVDLRPKTLLPLPWISHRFTCPAPLHAYEVLAGITQVAARVAEPIPAPHRLAVSYGDFVPTDIDVEIGVAVEQLPTGPAPTLPDGTPLTLSTLPRVEAVTGIRVGVPQLTAGFYVTVARWLDAHQATITGPVRELFLEIPDPANDFHAVVEIQFPIGPSPTSTG